MPPSSRLRILAGHLPTKHAAAAAAAESAQVVEFFDHSSQKTVQGRRSLCLGFHTHTK